MVAIALLLTAGCCSVSEDTGASALVEGNTEFALDLYGTLRAKDEGNLFFSPYSISAALAMTYAGAHGETAAQMADLLHLPGADDAVHAAFADLAAQLEGEDPAYQLKIANALWGQEGEVFLDTFLDTLERCYGAGLETVDFLHAAEQARKTINAWVEKQTEDKIRDLLKPGVLDAATRLVLTNAIYFKGTWSTTFDEKRTREMPFHSASGKKTDTDFMYKKDRVRYVERDDLQAIEMTYSGDDLAMLVLLPRAIDGLPKIEDALTPTLLADWIAGLRSQEVEVFLPKFKTTSEFSLAETLAAMGAPLPFGGGADFSGMAGTRDLFISAVVHKAFVDVTEEGTEAAAATAVVMSKSAAARPRERPVPVVRADHPFLFLIRDCRTGNVLFMGRFASPG